MSRAGGNIFISITSADIAATLSAFYKAGIYVYDAVYQDDLTIHCAVERKQFREVTKILQKRAEKWQLLYKSGLYYFLSAFIKRPVLIAGFALILFLTFFLPSRILFFEVNGNKTVPATQILQAARTCGIRFGASRRDVRSENVKNKLLEELPSIEWLGINTRGCVAILSVEERSIPEGSETQSGPVTSIVATADGIIDSCTVYSGTALCKAGDAVQKGQVLVSGYTDCGISIRAAAAKAEIYAHTLHSNLTVTPCDLLKRLQMTGKKKNVAIILGKKQINFSKGSGISGASCVKIKKEYPITLPGGFVIPVTFVVEEIFSYECRHDTQQDFSWVAKCSSDHLRSAMIAGSILSKTEQSQHGDGFYTLKTDYRCYEMIGKVKNEEIIH